MSTKRRNVSVRIGDFVFGLANYNLLIAAMRWYEYRVHIKAFKEWRKKHRPHCDDGLCMKQGTQADHSGLFQFRHGAKWALAVLAVEHPDEFRMYLAQARIERLVVIRPGSELAKLIDSLHGGGYPRNPAKSRSVGVFTLQYVCGPDHKFRTFNDRLNEKRAEELNERVEFIKQ